ncbi:glycosyltransferase family 2 protein [Clostridium perfringens]|uniref:glycosyltransferase family 2 protein n=1 Tax=Clostridium perfringens TaxID=1502 RepID=UPI0030CE33DC
MEKVSVIIPNFNAQRFLRECIDSVLKQSYKNVEIIIIDDGSTDDSWNIILEYANRYKNIIAKRQPNMNASVARNAGIEMATGTYCYFLDSDDIIETEALSIMVDTMENQLVDLVIGNYRMLYDDSNLLDNCKITLKNEYITDPIKLVGVVPNPSTKLYKTKVIRENQVYFGNVRIGQDLNFFLKYLLCSKNAFLLNEYIYQWRQVKTSMTNTYSFNILDITNTFKDVRKFYLKKSKKDVYDKYLTIVEYRHNYLQMEKQKYFLERKERKMILNYFSLHMSNLDVKSCLNFDEYKNDYLKCRIKLIFRLIYISKLYYFLDKKYCRKKRV